MTLDETVLETEALILELDQTLKSIAERYAEGKGDPPADRVLLRRLSHDWHASRARLTDASIRTQITSTLTYTQGIKRLDGAIKQVNAALDELEAETRSQRADRFASIIAKSYPALAPLAPEIARSPALFDRSLAAPGQKDRCFVNRATEKAKQIASDLNKILLCDSPYIESLILAYIDSGNLNEVFAYRKRLDRIAAHLPEDLFAPEENDRRPGHLTLRLDGLVPDLVSLCDTASLLGLEYQILENGLPTEPYLLSEPPRSFVSVDLETTGSWGVKKGDKPSEIIEIGAVKVIDGKIVDRFDLLIDPHRHITEPAKKITQITDEMVRGQPCAEEGVIRLAEFAEDLPFVGHDFLANDMPYLLRAANPAGLILSPACFDTFHYASAHKEEWELSGLSLKSLSEYFEIEHGQLHRAVEDAEVTAKVVLKMMED